VKAKPDRAELTERSASKHRHADAGEALRSRDSPLTDERRRTEITSGTPRTGFQMPGVA
jgi:hypothetical protein